MNTVVEKPFQQKSFKIPEKMKAWSWVTPTS